jgi:hypothetical protein
MPGRDYQIWDAQDEGLLRVTGRHAQEFSRVLKEAHAAKKVWGMPVSEMSVVQDCLGRYFTEAGS